MFINSLFIDESEEIGREKDDAENDEKEGESEIEEAENESGALEENSEEEPKLKNLKKIKANSEKIPSEKANNAKKGKSITIQKQIFDMIIGLRISMQKLFKNANAFSYLKMRKYISEIFANKEEKKIKIAIHAIKSFYDILLSCINLIQSLCSKGNLYNQKNLDISAISGIIEQIESEIDKLNKFKPKSSSKEESKDQKAILDIPIINSSGQSYLLFVEKSVLKTYENVEAIFESICKLYYAVFNIWHKKTLAYDNRKSKFGDSLNIFNFSENISKYLDLNFKKILSKYIITSSNNNANVNSNNSNTEQPTDLIYQYQDEEFYNNLLKDIISATDESSAENANSNESRFDYTYNYLLNRAQKTKKKMVDTKASKNRKLRFDKHEKLINFMVPVENLNVHVGRDAFIKSIFGLNRKMKDSNNREVYISRIEGLAKNAPIEDNDEIDIDII